MGTWKITLRAVQKTEAWFVKIQRKLKDSIRVVQVLLCIQSAGAEKSVVIKKRPVSLGSSSGDAPQSQVGSSSGSAPLSQHVEAVARGS